MNPTMKKIITQTSMVSAILATGVLVACTDETKVSTAVPQTSVATMLTISYQDIPSHYSTSGTVTSDHRVSISSRLSGYIREMNVREGDQVKVGQVLVRVDPVDAKQALIQTQADLADAKTDLERYKELLKDGAVSNQQVSKVELRYTVAKSHVEQARNQLSYAEVRSPVAGMVVEKRLSQGDLAAPGMPILTLEDPTSLLVETYVSERFVSHIREGNDVDIEIPSLKQTYQGIVRQVVQAADPVSHQFLVKTALPASHNIHPGMYAQTGFRLGNRKSILIPQAAIVSHSGLNAVYTVDENKVAHYRLIRLGTTQQGQVEVLAGLNAGDTIAFKGTPNLQTGMIVKASE
ncbi:MAG: efflux RND transporter periplasmic adaptor subunit [Ghiorsea sp.]